MVMRRSGDEESLYIKIPGDEEKYIKTRSNADRPKKLEVGNNILLP